MPRAMIIDMGERHPHPSKQPLLPLTMVLSLALGVRALRLGGRYATFGAGFAFAWFLLCFALYSLSWIQRDHAEWLESRRNETE